MSLQLSEKFSLPKLAALWTFAILAIKGAGKTYDAAKMAEQMIKLGIPIVVLDPMGIWWGLRVGVKGGEGLPVVIFGGAHADLPIPTSLSKNKLLIIDEIKLRSTVLSILKAGLSVILDTSQLSITQQTRTVAIFADELYRQNGPFGVRHVFIEEADVYAPQRPMGEKNASLSAIDNLVRRGGNFNLGCTMITQRSAVLNKDVLSQATCLIAMRILFKRDKMAVQEWVQNAVKSEREMKKLAKWYDSLKTLKNGEAWLYSPEHDDLFEKVQFGERETLHASREYFLQETWQQKNISLRDVSTFIEAYKATIKPKPTVQSAKPSVTSLISAKDSGDTTIKREISQEATVGEADDKTVGTPTVQWTETVGKTSSQTDNTSPTMDKMEMRVPTQQEASVQVHLPSTGPVEGTSGAQHGSALGEAPPQSIDILRSNPVIQTIRSVVEIRVPTDADHPKTALGKLAVIMKDDSRHSQHWTPTRAKKQFAARQWSDEGLEEAFNQMIAWGILTIQSNKAYSFKVSRVEITEKTVNVIAP